MSFVDTIKSWFSKPTESKEQPQEQVRTEAQDAAAAATPPSAPSPSEPVVTPPTTEEEGERPGSPGS